jgi:hypothetical protein
VTIKKQVFRSATQQICATIVLLPAKHQHIGNIYRPAASQSSADQQYLPVRCQPSIDVSAIFTGPLPANHQHIGNTYRSVASQASIT